MPVDVVVVQDQFIIYPYLGPSTLHLNNYLVLEHSLPFHAVIYNVTTGYTKI